MAAEQFRFTHIFVNQVILVPHARAALPWAPPPAPPAPASAPAAHRLLTDVVRKLYLYSNLTFTWHEVASLSDWWRSTTQRNRSAFRRLLKSGRLEVSSGGWVEVDEATTSLYGLLHQLVEGHQWLKQNLNYSARVAWLSAGSHGPGLAYLLAGAGVSHAVLARTHFAVDQHLAQRQLSDFLWVPAWRRAGAGGGGAGGGGGGLLAHVLQFGEDGVEACGPDRALCAAEFDFARADSPAAASAYTVRQRAELLLTQYSKAGSLSPHNVLLAPLARAAGLELQHHGYRQLADYINARRHVYRASVSFGTARDYFAAVAERTPAPPPPARGALLDHAEPGARPAYLAGRYSARPRLKGVLRQLEAALRSAELLHVMATGGGVAGARLLAARAEAARLAARPVSGGTLPGAALAHVFARALAAAAACWREQEAAAAALAGGALHKYLYRDGDVLSQVRSVAAGDVLLLFNSAAVARAEPLELLARDPALQLLGPAGALPLQVSPVWKVTSNQIKISDRFYKILVMVSVPGLSLQSLRVAAGRVDTARLRLLFDERLGFLRAVEQRATGARRTAAVDYAAFRSGAGAGPAVFAPNASAPLQDVLAPYRAGERPRLLLIVSGAVATDVTLVFGRLLQHSTRVLHAGAAGGAGDAVLLEARVDYEAAPHMRDLELFLSVQTDVASDELHTDVNGFQYTRRAARRARGARGLDGALRPATALAWLQDARRRASLATEQARGVAALRPGQLAALLGRGAAGAGASCHRLYLLLEDLAPPAPAPAAALPLPSGHALQLADSFTQPLEVFVAGGNASLPRQQVRLLRAPLPADVALVMLRALPARRGAAGAALLVLQRQAASCRAPAPRCAAPPLPLLHTLRGAKAFYRTSLTGTTVGERVTTLDYNNFGPMELISFIVVF
ncbi:alpha-mannosidase 2-like [Plutella xylostella]|uniref:alpha-mannosidase 2-like n=1 Tax=Plutella xylostella TaxID=51655 RepID=UPI00203227CB|nr:alpha-mannosidase 2-like [Plutella xylostella]